MDLNTKLINLNDLYCANCTNFLNTPIMLSKTAENICGRCYKNSTPPSDYLPNIALDNIIKQLIIPCRYKLDGCKTQLPCYDMEHHERICPLRKYKCPSKEKCLWDGALKNLLGHYETFHEHALVRSELSCFNFTIDISKIPNRANKLLIWNNELFLLSIKIEENVLFCLNYIGQNDQTLTYKYTIEEIGAIKGICFIQNDTKPIQTYPTNIDENNSISIDLRILKMCNSDLLQVKLKLIGAELQSLSEIDVSLLNQLECPICNHYMLPPIHQCMYGHNICNKCRPKIGICPTCRGKLGNTRNYALEAVSLVTKYPCINQDSGCTVVTPGSLIEKHEQECKLKKYQCPASHSCTWQGRESEIMGHLVNVHKLTDEYEVEININARIQMPHPGILSPDYNTYKTLIAYGEIFKVGYKFFNATTTYWSCKVVGVQNRGKYKYEIAYSNEMNSYKLVKYSECFVFTIDEEFYKDCLYFPNNITATIGTHVTCRIIRC